MGLRFRKSIKLAPGVKLNLNKKSTGITFGGKGAHYTINSSGKKTTSVGIPGTGLSYSTSTGGGKSSSKKGNSNTATSSNGNNNSGCGGCLLILLGICLAIAVLGFILTYAWIPGIIAAIYFAKKTTDPKQRKIRVGISIVVTLISFATFLSTAFQPELTELKVTWNKQEYEINEDPILELSVLEEGAEITSLEIVDNDIATVSYEDGVATIDFIGEGTAFISFTANGEIKSNETTITVIDKEAEEQRKKEAEEKKKAEEEAKKEAEAEAKKQKEQKEEPQEEPQEEMVWIPSSGSKYHSNAGCSNMENPTEVPISKAKSRGFGPCGRCY